MPWQRLGLSLAILILPSQLGRWFPQRQGCIPAVQSMKAVSAAHGVSPASQPVEGFWFPFPQFLVLLRVGFGGAGLEGWNERICTVHDTLNYGSLQKVAWNFSSCFHTLSHCLGEQDNVQCVQLSPAVCPSEPKDSTAVPSCASKLPLPRKHGEPPVRRQVADGWEHRGTGRNMPAFPQQSSIQTIPEQTDSAQLSVLPCIPTRKEQSSAWLGAIST